MSSFWHLSGRNLNLELRKCSPIQRALLLFALRPDSTVGALMTVVQELKYIFSKVKPMVWRCLKILWNAKVWVWIEGALFFNWWIVIELLWFKKNMLFQFCPGPVPSLVDQEKLGTFFLEPPPLDLSLCYEDSSPCIPCLGFLFWFLNWHWNHWNLNMNEIWNDIFISDSDLSRLIYILASGSDPMADIQKLAETSLAYSKPVPGSHYQRTVDLLICRSEVTTVCRICEYFVILHNSYSHRWPSLQTLNMQLSKAWYACQDQSHQLGSGARSKGGNPYLINMPLVISSHLSRPLLVLMKDPNPANGSFRRGCLISLRGISGWRRLKKWRRFREECSMTVIFCDSLRREVAEMLSVRRHGILKILLALHQSQRRYCSFYHNQQIDQWRFLSENGRSCCRIVTWRRASCQHWNQSFATKVISTAQCLVVAEYQSSQWQRVFLRWKSLTQKAWTRSLPFDQGEWSTIVFFFKMLFSLAMLDFKKYTMKQDACLHLFTPD